MEKLAASLDGRKAVGIPSLQVDVVQC